LVCLTRSRKVCYSYTCCSDRHASPYWTLIPRISMGFTPSVLKKQEMHVATWAAIFTPLLRCHVAFLHRTATCQPLFKPRVSLLSTYKTIELCFKFLLHFFMFFIWLSLIANVNNGDVTSCSAWKSRDMW
jgi:hypothetical protein